MSVNNSKINSFSSLEEARKFSLNNKGNEIIVEKKEEALFNYVKKTSYEVYSTDKSLDEAIKDSKNISNTQKGIKAIEVIFDDKIIDVKTSKELKNIGNVYAFNSSEIGKGTIKVINNNDKNLTLSIKIDKTSDILNLDITKNKIKSSIQEAIKDFSFSDDIDDQKLIKNMISHYLDNTLEKIFTSGQTPELTFSFDKKENGKTTISLVSDFPLVGKTSKELEELNITTNKEGKTIIPLGNINIIHDINKSPKPELFVEVLGLPIKPVEIKLKEVANIYKNDENTIKINTEKGYKDLSRDDNVSIGIGSTWIGNNSSPSLNIGYRKDIKDYALAKINWGTQLDILPTNLQLQVTPTLGTEINALKYTGVPITFNADIGPSLGNMSSDKSFNFGIKTGLGAKYEFNDQVNLGVSYSHVFGIKGESQNTIGLNFGVKF
ncbi:MAG: hypothetical protein KatS3mg068_0994 [Candidatus Sericytochromatia bacterium]|nr:MAG: hypothetical protein KatS3mg068_0994 [Candidatus Sericytochromatia bacterium]